MILSAIIILIIVLFAIKIGENSMDTIIFQNASLPVQVELENVALREMHS